MTIASSINVQNHLIISPAFIAITNVYQKHSCSSQRKTNVKNSRFMGPVIAAREKLMLKTQGS